MHGVIYIATKFSYFRTIYFERALRINNDKVLGLHVVVDIVVTAVAKVLIVVVWPLNGCLTQKRLWFSLVINNQFFYCTYVLIIMYHIIL